MLIGPTLTLEKLEEHLIKEEVANKREIDDLARELNILQGGVTNTDKVVRDEEGTRIENPKFKKVLKEFEDKEEEYISLNEKQDFIKAKLVELKAVEDYSQGIVNKEKDTITLTLNDCVMLGVKVD